jgi:hypothetical protein
MSSSCWLSRYSSERKHSGEKSLHSWIALNRITRADRAESISPVWYGDSRVRRVLRNGQKKTFFHLSSSYNVCWTCWWRKWKGNSLASLLPGISFIKQRVNFRLPLLLDAHAPFILFTQKSPPPLAHCSAAGYYSFDALSFRLFCHSGATWWPPRSSSCLLRV